MQEVFKRQIQAGDFTVRSCIAEGSTAGEQVHRVYVLKGGEVQQITEIPLGRGGWAWKTAMSYVRANTVPQFLVQQEPVCGAPLSAPCKGGTYTIQ